MTEQEWLVCDDPVAMLDAVMRRPQQAAGSNRPNPMRPSDRKLRLWACACCRQVWYSLKDHRSREAVGVVECLADGGAADVRLAFAGAWAAVEAMPKSATSSGAWYAAWAVAELTSGQALVKAVQSCAAHVRAIGCRAGEGPAQAALLCDIVGNPFALSPRLMRPVAWLLTCLAHGAYDERLPDGALDPRRLAVLADALEEAGPYWYAEELVRHLRSTGPHTRGCWALDLILGKE